ncbi:uncharacterized transmembrane protein DDB_G0281039 [Nematostella vectensis]|uniref:uncharacterized transmembrane protein DDB_G0281039 n=1 Tax=Nematostella vectensis TaxID=45351 RepID=UPI0013906D48|nr:uncharacterized transmembrane protein DDB_G0281039 [Nematostella vectensis]
MAFALEWILVVLAFGLVSTAQGADNSTYTEPEEVSDSIPVAITILVILILLVLIFIIILLIVCIRLMNRSSQKKDIEETPMQAYQETTHHHPTAQHEHPRHEPQTQVVYVAPQQQQPTQARQQTPPPRQHTPTALERRKTPQEQYGRRSPPVVNPDQNCQCEACNEIRRARKEGRAPRV